MTLLALLASTALGAGPTDVVVRERHDGDPIAGAVVRVGDQEAVTDAAGRAVLHLADGTHVVEVHRPGYASGQVEVEAGSEARVWLEVRTTYEVVVEGFRPIAHPTRHAVDAEQAFETPGVHEDAARLVQSLPGVAVQREYGPSAGDLWIRGAAPRESRIYLDGIEVPYLYHYNQYASVFPASQIDTLELFPSTFGAAYGDAVGGIAEARTPLERPEAPHGSVGASFVMAGGDVRVPLRNGWVAVAGRRSFLDAAGERSAQFPRWPRFHDASARLELGDAERGTGVFLWSAADGYTRAAGELDVLDPVEQQTTPRVDFRRAFEVAGVRHHWKSGRAVLAAVHYDNVAALSRGGREDLDDLTVTSRLDVRGRRDRLGWEAGWELRGSRTALEVEPGGHDALLVAEEGPSLARGEPLDAVLHRGRAAAYAQLAWAPGPLQILPGLRIGGDTTAAKLQVEPRFTARWRISERTALDLGGGRYVQRPESELVLAAPDLPTTASWQASGGLEHAVGGRLEIGLDLWHKWLRNPLVVPIEGAPWAADRGRAAGVELVSRYRLRERFFLWGWVALSRSTWTDGGPPVPSDGDQAISAGLVASVDLGRWNLGLRYRYGSGLPWTPIDGSLYDAGRDDWVPLLGPPNSARYPAYQKVDVRVAHTWPLRGWELTASMEVWYVPPPSAQLFPVWSHDYREQGWVIGPTLLPLGSLRASF